MEEANGAFERDPRTWYPDPGSPPSPLGKPAVMPPGGALPEVKTGTNLRRTADGKPDLTGYYQSNAGGANYGLEQRRSEFRLTPSTRGVVIDPPDRTLPYQPWARAERINREEPYRGYDDPTAHCFVAGVPRSLYVPSPMQILQPPGYVVMLFERMSWRIIPYSSGWTRAHSGQRPAVAGRFGGALGRRHPGGGYDQSERQGLAERGGRRGELRRTRGGAISFPPRTARSRTGPRSPTRLRTRGRGRSRFR